MRSGTSPPFPPSPVCEERSSAGGQRGVTRERRGVCACACAGDKSEIRVSAGSEGQRDQAGRGLRWGAAVSHSGERWFEEGLLVARSIHIEEGGELSGDLGSPPPWSR